MRINADLKYSNEEYETVRKYLSERGLKTGPYLRAKLLMEAIEWAKVSTSTTQIDMDALRGMGGNA